jgi:hypothetical protein
MKKILRRWLSKYKNSRKKDNFERATGVGLDALIKSCEEVVFRTTGSAVYTEFQDLGGANNHGMLMHYATSNDQPVAISKVEDHVLAEREHRFLTWQKNHRKNSLSANPLGLVRVPDHDFSCFISTVLEHPVTFSYPKAIQLYKRLGQKTDLISYLTLSGRKEELKGEIDATTNIKSILVNLVSDFGTDNSEIFYKDFLQRKENLFINNHDLFIKLQDLMDRIYTILKTYDLTRYIGLVHGDFKPQNILEYKESYRVIDCQYYTYGIRLWDIAFLYSKDVYGFKTLNADLENFPLYEERILLTFFYVIASLINVKKKRADGVIKNKISPVMVYAINLLATNK